MNPPIGSGEGLSHSIVSLSFTPTIFGGLQARKAYLLGRPASTGESSGRMFCLINHRFSGENESNLSIAWTEHVQWHRSAEISDKDGVTAHFPSR